ncbi:MAG: hypothetical protein M0D55_13490 [Elusimicrobiota bacterium]|nr:MAG: hypothetical protein M0D55_13490 [Elusimicrobiota bacterium]
MLRNASAAASHAAGAAQRASCGFSRTRRISAVVHSRNTLTGMSSVRLWDRNNHSPAVDSASAPVRPTFGDHSQDPSHSAPAAPSSARSSIGSRAAASDEPRAFCDAALSQYHSGGFST